MPELKAAFGETPGQRTYRCKETADGNWHLFASNAKRGSIWKAREEGFHARLGALGGKWKAEDVSIEDLFVRCVEVLELDRLWKEFEFEPDWDRKFSTPPGMKWGLWNFDFRYGHLDRDLAMEQAKRDHKKEADALHRRREAVLNGFVSIESA